MAPTIRFRVSLACAHCGVPNDAASIHLYTSGLGNDPIDTNASPGTALELELADFEDGYLMLRAPREDEPTFAAIELWGCRNCNRLSAARLEFRRRTPHVVELAGARVVPLSKAVLDEAHFISRRIADWAASPGDDAERLAELERRLS